MARGCGPRQASMECQCAARSTVAPQTSAATRVTARPYKRLAGRRHRGAPAGREPRAIARPRALDGEHAVLGRGPERDLALPQPRRARRPSRRRAALRARGERSAARLVDPDRDSRVAGRRLAFEQPVDAPVPRPGAACGLVVGGEVPRADGRRVEHAERGEVVDEVPVLVALAVALRASGSAGGAQPRRAARSRRAAARGERAVERVIACS